ncbi:four helix bundle protein [Patescibacteria group bacterium]
MPIKSFRDLDVYKESLQLSRIINDLTKTFPKNEKFLLADQMKRASRSIPSLIAESWVKRKFIKVFRKYMRDSIGEANEMMNHLEQACLFGYISEKKSSKLIERYDNLAGKLFNLKDNWQNY